MLKQHVKEIDLIITDIIMPEMGGLELSKKVKKIRSDIRFIYISGYTDEAISRYGEIINELTYLQKPFEPKEILAMTRSVLDGNLTG